VPQGKVAIASAGFIHSGLWREIYSHRKRVAGNLNQTPSNDVKTILQGQKVATGGNSISQE
jgi:hypothetical protein